MSSILDIEGIGQKYAKTLAEIGIKTTGALLKQGVTKGKKRN
jgi:predicted flap endonuclease-1-like 5' DNA nuclease